MTHEATGDCYEAAFEFLMETCIGPHWLMELYANDGERLRECPLLLVHAEAVGQGPIAGIRFGHAFVLDPEKRIVFEVANGRRDAIPQALYYRLGQIDDSKEARENFKYIEYTADEALDAIRDARHYGPWDLETEY